MKSLWEMCQDLCTSICKVRFHFCLSEIVSQVWANVFGSMIRDQSTRRRICIFWLLSSGMEHGNPLCIGRLQVLLCYCSSWNKLSYHLCVPRLIETLSIASISFMLCSMAGKNMSFKDLSENAMHYKLEGGTRQCGVGGKKWLKLEFLGKSDTLGKTDTLECLSSGWFFRTESNYFSSVRAFNSS